MVLVLIDGSVMWNPHDETANYRRQKAGQETRQETAAMPVQQQQVTFLFHTQPGTNDGMSLTVQTGDDQVISGCSLVGRWGMPGAWSVRRGKWQRRH